ncbi:MAG: dockerin type I repeat-containing protein, partial [Muribaculaceae bacterium]|nr:dockerin type I repeat-containing protein [Muribaculaceae bacterium]
GTGYYFVGDAAGNIVKNATVVINGTEEQQSQLVGDVNGDGRVNVSDVTTLVNMILGVIPKDETRADINGDGKINVSDVTALVNIILGIN